MKISVVTPVFRDPRITSAIGSVFAQQGEFEIESLVVDGASHSEAMLRALSQVESMGSHVVSEPDKGIYDAMNKGLLGATGEVVGILNADDRYAHDGVLSAVAEAFRNPSVMLAYGDLIYVDVDDRPLRHWRSGSPSRYWKWLLGWTPPHPTFFVRRDAYQRYGLFDLSFPFAADYDLMQRMMVTHRLRTAYIPQVLVRMATGGASNGSVRTIVRNNLEVWQICRKNFRLLYPWIPFLKPVRKILQFPRAVMFR